MTIRLNGSTSGYTEIDCPSVGGNNTLVLPTGNGSSGQVLSTNGSGALSWIGAGKILQVAQATLGSTVTTSSTSATSTGLSVSITPSSSSNKVLLFASATIGHSGTNLARFAFARGTTVINGGSGNSGAVYYINTSGNGNTGVPWSMTYLDSPSTTSSTTYSVYYWTDFNTVSFNGRQIGDTAGLATIIAMEVAA